MVSRYKLSDGHSSGVDLQALESKLNSIGRKIELENGELFQPHKGEVSIIDEGGLMISNSLDEDAISIGIVHHLTMIGLIERFNPNMMLFYKAEGHVSLITMTDDEFDKVFFENIEFRPIILYLMTQLTVALVHIYYERNKESRYATIREMIIRYQNQKDLGEIKREGLASFILRRTGLSRSYVFQVLNALKVGGYISMKSGKLISINKSIPMAF